MGPVSQWHHICDFLVTRVREPCNGRIQLSPPQSRGHGCPLPTAGSLRSSRSLDGKQMKLLLPLMCPPWSVPPCAVEDGTHICVCMCVCIHMYIYIYIHTFIWASLMAQMVKNPPAMPMCEAWVGKIPWRREWQPTQVFMPKEFHGQRNLAGYSPSGCKNLNTTELLSLSHMYTHIYCTLWIYVSVGVCVCIYIYIPN